MLNQLRFLYPLTVSFLNSPQSLGTISPLVIGLLPFLLIAEIRRNVHLEPAIRHLLYAVVITLAVWVYLFITVVEIRYVMFLWILLFLPMALLLESAQKTRPSLFCLSCVHYL